MVNVPSHQTILIQILKDIYGNKELMNSIVFKGGTALYFFYDLGRFSVDLDFDLIDESRKEAVFIEIEKILKKYGEIKERQDKRSTLFFLLSYGQGERNIKVEISKRKPGSDYEIKSYLGIPMLVMKKEDMFANKLVALTERSLMANRDIYDIWFFAKNGHSFNEDIIEKRTGKKARDFLGECIRLVEKTDNTHILRGLGDLLDEKQKSWSRANLKKETIFWLKYYKKNMR